MQNLFKIGDKVKFILGGTIGWEYKEGNFNNIDIYTISAVNSGGIAIDYGNPEQWDIQLQNMPGFYHPDHFKRAMLTNEERIAARKKELHALV